MIKLVTFIITLLSMTLGQRQELSFQNGNYILGWEIINEMLNVDIKVQTLGYIGFGLTNIGGPGMRDSDIVIVGHDESDGLNYIGDFYGRTNGPPDLDGGSDSNQNAELLEATQTNGETFVRWRKPLNTGDIDDIQFDNVDNTDQFFMWSYSANNSDIVTYHAANRGKILIPRTKLAKLPRFA